MCTMGVGQRRRVEVFMGRLSRTTYVILPFTTDHPVMIET